jgi:hypothetical protein
MERRRMAMCAAMSRGTQNAVWTLLVVITALVGGIIAVGAQESVPSSASLKRIRAALQSPQQPISSDGVPLFSPGKPDEVQLGIVTFLPPDGPGQVVSMRVPVGALISRVAHSVGTTQHRRAERAARDEVAKALAEFQRAQPK